MQQLALPLADPDRLSGHAWLMGLPREWDRTHPAYLRYGLGPVLDVPRYVPSGGCGPAAGRGPHRRKLSLDMGIGIGIDCAP